jgi:hypothetical protein
MQPIKFPESNFTFGAPVGWPEEKCSPLPVWKGEHLNGEPAIVSCWKLSPEELELIQRTGHVFLTVVGAGTPPVSLSVESPFLSVPEDASGE